MMRTSAYTDSALLAADFPNDPREEARLAERLDAILRADGLARSALRAARAYAATGAIPAWRIVSGCLYQAVWNSLTGRPSGYGVGDVDLAYFDDGDLGYAAEDATIRGAAPYFVGLAAPVELRNQARVHLWYPEKFGAPYPPLATTDEALERYAALTHAVGARLMADDRIDVVAPFGLARIFEMRLAPNRRLENRATYEAKAARHSALWPELSVEPW